MFTNYLIKCDELAKQLDGTEYESKFRKMSFLCNYDHISKQFQVVKSVHIFVKLNASDFNICVYFVCIIYKWREIGMIARVG